jgi:hypothetical protein
MSLAKVWALLLLAGAGGERPGVDPVGVLEWGPRLR